MRPRRAAALQHIAGLDNVLVLERGGEPLALLGAVPVDCGRRRGVWFSGMLTRPMRAATA